MTMMLGLLRRGAAWDRVGKAMAAPATPIIFRKRLRVIGCVVSKALFSRLDRFVIESSVIALTYISL